MRNRDDADTTQWAEQPASLLRRMATDERINDQANCETVIERSMTIPNVQEILVLHATEIKAELLRRAPDGPWPHVTLLSGGTVTLDSIDFAAPLAAFYRTVEI